MLIMSAGVFDTKTELAIIVLIKEAVLKWQQSWFNNCLFDVDINFNKELFSAFTLRENQVNGTHKSGISIYADSLDSNNPLLLEIFNCNEHTMQALLNVLHTGQIDNLYVDLLNEILSGLSLFIDQSKNNQQPVVEIKLTWQKVSLSVYMDASVVDMWLISNTSQLKKQYIRPLKQAIQNSLVPMCVSLQTEPINFVDVMCLKKGDVIMLKQEVQKPISIDVNDAKKIALGYLVERDNNKAIIFLES